MSFLKALNEAFDNYKCDECNELNESNKHFDLLMALKAARETLQRDGNNNLKAYEIAYQNVLEDYFPDKSWWEVTDCNIFNDLMETRDPEMTEINIIKGIKDDVDESLKESFDKGFKFMNGTEYEVLDSKGDYTLVYSKAKKYTPYVVAWKLAKDRDGDDYSWGQGHYFQNKEDAEKYLAGVDESLKEARNPEHDEENEIIKRVYEPGRRKYSDVKKDIKKLGYEIDVDSNARKEFGRDYFGDRVTITNPVTGRKISGSQNSTWRKDRYLRAGENEIDPYGYGTPNADRKEFDYKGFLDKPLGWKPSTEKSTVQQFKDDKQLVKDNQRVLDAADRLSKVRDRMAARKTNESLKVVDEVSLKDFNFRPEAADRLKYLTDDQLLQLESALEDMYPDGMTADQLNEFVWFEDDTIAQILGFEDFDEVMEQGVQR